MTEVTEYRDLYIQHFFKKNAIFVPPEITWPVFIKGTFTENPRNDFEMRTTVNNWLEMTFTHHDTHNKTQGVEKHQSLVCYKQATCSLLYVHLSY